MYCKILGVVVYIVQQIQGDSYGNCHRQGSSLKFFPLSRTHAVRFERPSCTLLFLFPVKTYQCSNIGIGLLVQQKLCHSVVATVSSDMQRCEVVQCDIIHRRLVLQQQFNTLYVVSLG